MLRSEECERFIYYKYYYNNIQCDKPHRPKNSGSEDMNAKKLEQAIKDFKATHDFGGETYEIDGQKIHIFWYCGRIRYEVVG